MLYRSAEVAARLLKNTKRFLPILLIISTSSKMGIDFGPSKRGPALLVAKCYSPAGEVIRRHFDVDPIANHNPDAKLANLALGLRDNLVLVLELHLEHRVGQLFHDRARGLQQILFQNMVSGFPVIYGIGGDNRLIRSGLRPLDEQPPDPEYPCKFGWLPCG